MVDEADFGRPGNSRPRTAEGGEMVVDRAQMLLGAHGTSGLPGVSGVAVLLVPDLAIAVDAMARAAR